MVEQAMAFLAYLCSIIFIIGFSFAAVQIVGGTLEESNDFWLLYGQGRER